jgi:hypothetical protein
MLHFFRVLLAFPFTQFEVPVFVLHGIMIVDQGQDLIEFLLVVVRLTRQILAVDVFSAAVRVENCLVRLGTSKICASDGIFCIAPLFLGFGCL